MPRPIRAVVKPTAISLNINKIKQLMNGRSVMPVVKANAYGHGLARIMQGLSESDALAILEIDGARQLRELGWQKPIVLLEGCFDAHDLQAAMQLQCDWVVHNQAQLSALAGVAGQTQAHTPRIFLKLNTGMNRLGFDAASIGDSIRWLDQFTQEHNWPTPVLMTHFANADEGEPRSRLPQAEDQHRNLMRLKPVHWQSSLGNSAAVLNLPEIAGDIVRPGIAIYGATPGPHAAANYGLLPAMRLESEIIAVQHILQGSHVGYGSRWQAGREGRIAVVACGYADGYPRHAPDGTPTFVEGHVAPLVGRVSMDMLTIDITDIPAAGVGSTVQLWGEDIPVDVVADRCGTIGYELLCAVTTRVPFITA